MTDARVGKAIETAQRLFGAPVDAGVSNDDGRLTLSFAHIYGEVWPRDDVALKTRSLAVVSALVAMARPDEMRIHLKGALNIGWRREELREIFLMLGYYAGFPAALDALRLLDEATGNSSTAKEDEPAEKHFILFYDAAPDYLARRGAFRAEHLALARAAAARGEIVLAGAFADPADGAALIFRGPNDASARAFAEADPYVRNGLVTSWRVREWTTVVGDGASTKV